MANAPLVTVLGHLRKMVHAQEFQDASDGELLRRFLAGREEAAFVALVRRHGPMVLQVCRRVRGHEQDAEDVFQATFLLLARKAGGIRKQESVASWLHGVAHRLALKARKQKMRRAARERRAADMRKTSELPNRAWQELQATLDEALREVPEIYRAPLLLCYLEGKTQEEAAGQGGCPLGTLRSRLARGRGRLKEVLERKGIRLSAAALAAALAVSAAPAALPALVLNTTARAGLAYAAGTAPAEVVSAGAAALAESGLKGLRAVMFKLATLALLAAGALVLGTGLLTRQAAADASPAKPETGPAPTPKGNAQNAAAASQAPESREEVTVRGRVLDPAGRPLPGARILLLGKGGRPRELGVSGSDGRFSVQIPKKSGYQYLMDWLSSYLIARAKGAGIDFVSLWRFNPANPVEFRLVRDGAIRGRVVDTQGKPVPGVRVTVGSLNVYADNSLDPFLAEWKKRDFQSGIPSGVKHMWCPDSSLLTTTTAADGRFTLHGTGAERLASLRFHGSGIADAEAWVVNRKGFDPRPYNEATRNNTPKEFERFALGWRLQGPDVSLVAEAEKPIRGTVRAADTGKGRPGVEVWLTRNGNALVSPVVKARTDARGRYEIHGARKANSYMVEVKGDPATGYMGSQVRAADTPGFQPITADIRVMKGVIITGKVIDRTTGKPVPGFAMADVLSDNPFVKKYPEFRSSVWIGIEKTGPDGTFRVVTIPGPVLLMGGADPRRLPAGSGEEMKYRPPVPDPRYPQYFRQRPDTTDYYLPGGGFSPVQGNYCKVLQIKPGTAIVHDNIYLDQATARQVQIQDAAGRPLTGVWVTGVSHQNWQRPIRFEKASCPAYDVQAGKPRVMVFYEPTKNLFGTLTVKADAKGPAVVKLGRGGEVRGYLRGADGKPLAGYVVMVSYTDRVAEEIHEYAHRAKQVVTDADGRFRIDDLVPGLPFRLFHYRTRRDSYRRKPALPNKDLTVRPGEALDLGNLREPGPRGRGR